MSEDTRSRVGGPDGPPKSMMPGRDNVEMERGDSSSNMNSLINRKTNEVFYDTHEDSEGAKCCRHITFCGFGCCDNHVRITQEFIRIDKWQGCSKKTLTFDIDNIDDLALREPCGPCMCLYGRGHIRVYGRDSDQKDEFFECRNIEKAAEVFIKLSEWVHKTTDLKLGLSRPEMPHIPWVIYDSNLDSGCIKCVRTGLCCGCLRPTTRVTKSGVTQAQWNGCTYVTKRMDMDNIQGLSKSVACYAACCDAGTIRVFGRDSDQQEEFFDINWVGNVEKAFKDFNDYQVMLDNRNRAWG